MLEHDAYTRLLLQIGRDKLLLGRLVGEAGSTSGGEGIACIARRGSCLGASLNFRSRHYQYKEPNCVTAALKYLGGPGTLFLGLTTAWKNLHRCCLPLHCV